MAAMAPKRSLFSKPSWASSKGNSVPSTAGSIFGNRVYEGILEAERKRKEEEAIKAQAHAGNAKSQDGDDEPDIKRQRISKEADEHTQEIQKSSNKKGESQDPQVLKNSATKYWKGSLDEEPTGPQTPSVFPPKSVDTKPAVIELGDDEEDSDMYGSPATKSTPKASLVNARQNHQAVDPNSEYDDDDDDEYTRELKKKARERVRAQRPKPIIQNPEAVSPASPTVRSPSVEQAQTNSTSKSTFLPELPAQQPSVDDPLVRILITPTIPNTNPLIVNRRASQTMKMVKEFWCKCEGLDNQTAAKVFLTWRGNRLWNSSTMQGPLRQLKKERPNEIFNIEEEEESLDAGGEQKGARIEVHAMTEETYREYLRKQERKAAAANRETHIGIDEGDDGDGNEDGGHVSRDAGLPAGDGAAPSDNKITIQLVSRGLSPMFLRVRPDTTIGAIMAGFKKMKGLGPDKTPWLTFDGERLDPTLTVTEVQLEHEDTVEVHVR